jgi:hypothetical protein
MKDQILIVTSLVGFGDLLYMTPFIRFLKKCGADVEVWGLNTEPLECNPDIKRLVKPETSTVKIPPRFHKAYKFLNISPNPSNQHTIDFFTQQAGTFTLPNRDKELVFRWLPRDEEAVGMLMKEHGLKSARTGRWNCNFVTMCPAVNWKSRTLPLEFYKELAARIQENGDKVVLVGKNVDQRSISDNREVVSETMAAQESKSVYDPSEFPGAVDLIDRLSLRELACLHSYCKLAVNSENGNMVISCTNDTCWNLYIPTLTPPEFRLPWRKGSQSHKTVVVANKDNYFPVIDYKLMRKHKGTLYDVPVRLPCIDDVYDAYRNLA